MANVFFRPELGRQFKGVKKENEIKGLVKQALRKGKEIEFDDICSVIEWLENEAQSYMQLREEANKTAQQYMIRREELLSIPAVESIMKENLMITDIGLSPPICYELKRSGISTISELCGKSDSELACMRRIGQKGLEKIKERLAYYGLCLDDPEKDNQNRPFVEKNEKRPLESDFIMEELSRKFDELFGSFSDEED